MTEHTQAIYHECNNCGEMFPCDTTYPRLWCHAECVPCRSLVLRVDLSTRPP